MTKDDRGLLLRIVRCARIFTDEEVMVASELLDAYLADSPDYMVDVAVRSSGPVGYICYGRAPMTVGTFNLYWIVVDMEKKQNGIGRSLVDAMEKSISKWGGRMIAVETSSRSLYKPAVAFYEKIGYKEIAEVPDFYSAGDSKLIFIKVLP